MNPLTKADLTKVRQALYECNQCSQLIEKVKACGVDCSEQEARRMHLEGFLTQVNQQFGAEYPDKGTR